MSIGKKGKPLKEYLSQFYEVTAKASEINRSLALGGIGIIWLFKNVENSSHLLPEPLITPLHFIILSLVFDLFQYVLSGIFLKIFHFTNENKLSNNTITEADAEKLEYKDEFEYIVWIFYIVKIIFMLFGYYYIYQFVINKL